MLPFNLLVRQWFSARFRQPTAPQEAGWSHISRGTDTLVAAPTGSGKTLAAFLWSIDRLIRQAEAGTLEEKTSVVYVSPLKALGNDVEKNLSQPLVEIQTLAATKGIHLPQIRVAVRSGDTPGHERRLMLRHPPHILITTPESLYILLTAEQSRKFLKTAETVIVDEIHAVAGDKRGAHLALSLERLDALADRPLQRIGLSATQKPIKEIARLLVGTKRIEPDGTAACAVVDVGHQRDLDLSIEVPDQELGPIVKHEIWADVYEKIVNQVKAHRTTLVFVNTRRLVERVAHQLTARLGDGKVGAHHGSLSRKSRLEVEQGLKSGTLPVVVATASLELGIDIGFVELVCHIGAPRTLATFLQRIGRSGHWLGATPKGILYPLTRDELVQCGAVIRAVRAGELDKMSLPEKPLDVLAQQMVATVASTESMSVEELWELVRGAYPYRSLGREAYDQLLEMLSEGIARRRGRRSAYLHYDRVHDRLRARRGARLTAITSGGAIPDTADYDVVKLPDEAFVGKVNEDFAIESLSGDIFLLGNSSWRIHRVSSGKVWVEDAHGLPPSIPFWLGEAPGRSLELSAAVADLRAQVTSRLSDPSAALRWLIEETKIAQPGAEQIVSYIRETEAVLGCIPTLECVVAERFFDEAGGMQLVLHAPFGSKINRAWGLALRKRFCVSFDRELQAAATDDGIVLSLGEQHSFPLEEVFSMVRLPTLEKELTQAALASPMFVNRWRWDASRALAVPRFNGGKKVPMAIQRMRAEDLLAAVFPEQLMCQDNRVGPVELPDHPLVRQTLDDCLHEAMDVDGLREIIARIENGKIRTVALDSPAPSAMAHEILNANPYAFLDDAPLEERRARAVALRRTDPELAVGMGALSPQAVEEVREQAWPKIRDAEEFHDVLLGLCLLPLEEGRDWSAYASELIQNGRATVVSWHLDDRGDKREAYAAVEQLSLIAVLFPGVEMSPTVKALPRHRETAFSSEEVFRRAVQGWMEVLGPTTVSSLARRLGLPPTKVEQALLALEAGGVVLRGRFTQTDENIPEVEWCERGLLSRIHRLTLGRLRRDIEPVTAADFMKFLLCWQHADPQSQLRGREGLLEVIGQLQGLELPAPAWEQSILPSRITEYDPGDLESLCLGGTIAWGRVRTDEPSDGPAAEHYNSPGGVSGKRRRRRRMTFTRVAPISFLLRDDLGYFLFDDEDPSWDRRSLSSSATAVARYLKERGASFLGDIARGTGLLKSQAEETLWELVAIGLVTGDGIAGLRVLLTPEVKRRGRRRLRLLAGGRAPERLMPVGRWSLWRGQNRTTGMRAGSEEEFLARQFLRRYGVVFRDLLARESSMPPWRTLLQVYRRLEARGEIRGGRFVNGFLGEQFALSEAVDLLRALRRSPAEPKAIVISSADPLNLIGVIVPGQRLSPYSNQSIVYADGVPVDIGPLGAIRSRLQRAKPA
jgi:ATP-dependent helicase Lhr and Lhr-like helicase